MRIDRNKKVGFSWIYPLNIRECVALPERYRGEGYDGLSTEHHRSHMDVTYTTTDESTPVQCPYCGEWIDLQLDLSIPEQDCIEDCQVCCRPMDIRLRQAADGAFEVVVRRDDD